MLDCAVLTQGRQALLAGDFVRACGELEAVLAQTPHDAECLFLLGVARHGLHEATAARDAFLNVTVLDSQHLQSRLALAAVCLELGDAAAAVAACLEASRIAPRNPEVWFSLGVAHDSGNAPSAALEAYDFALRLAPEHSSALKNRRALLLAIGRIDEAVTQSQIAVARHPFSVDAQFELGESLTAAHRFIEAARVFGRAATLAPQSARVALHYGFALAQVERFAEAQQQLDLAVELDPVVVRAYRQSIFGKEQEDAATALAHLDARVLFLLRHYDQIERCDWSERGSFIRHLSAMIANEGNAPMTDRALGFRAAAMGLEPALQRKLAHQIATGIENSLPDSGVVPFHAVRTRRVSKRIRIGYLSPNFGLHPVSLLLGDMLSWHDRERFEVIAYSIGEDDASEQRRRIVAGCDTFVDLVGQDDDSAARRIAADSIDVLIDLVGYLDKARPGILARRPAPLQVAWLDHLATSGASWIDYIVADAVSLPVNLAVHFSEAAIRVPQGIYLCSYADRPLALPPGRSSLGLPGDAVVLGVMHNHYKIDPDVFSVWMRLLEANPRAVLWLIDGRGETKSFLRAAAVHSGIAPERLIFSPKLPHDEHLVRLQTVDLALDTPQCNGGATTADALAAGVPVLACVGSTLLQRVAASLLTAAGQPDLIADDLAHYEFLAHQLIASPERMTGVRQRIEKARATALFYSPKKWLGHFESGIESAWRRHRAGSVPADIKVDA